jgi:catechol 2,3-dioxygenase-like lactoylglutathione lyase family enzyme
MLGSNDAIATIAVKDLKMAAPFYEEKLGLRRIGPNEPTTAAYTSGNAKVLVYESQFAGTNQATAATWIVKDVDAVVNDLKAKGVTFEHYNFPGMTLEGDVHVAGNHRVAWFTDPDGNILAIVNDSTS